MQSRPSERPRKRPRRMMSVNSIKKYVTWIGLMSFGGVCIAFYKLNSLNNKVEPETYTHLPTSKQRQQEEKILDNKTSHNILTSGDLVLRLNQTCRTVDMESSAYQNWPVPAYSAFPSLDFMLCPIKLVKTEFWKEFYKMLRKEGRMKGVDGHEKTATFGDDYAKRLKLLIMSINPYTWILQGYVEKSLLGVEICKEIFLRRYIDKVISGVKLRQNQGTIFTPLVPFCRPCDVKIHSVIRYENFDADLTSFLHSLDLDHLKSELLRNDKDVNIRRDMTDLTLSAIRRFTSHECQNITDFKVRLLEAFKIRGYEITDKFYDYIFNLKHLNTRDVRKQLSNLAYGTKLASDESRNAVQKEYYKTVSPETIQYVQEIFKFEFEAFGYDKMP